MAYTVQISSAARRLARKLPEDVRRAIVLHGKRLAAKPQAGEKLKGRLSFLYSYHFNHKGVFYRIIYEISQNRQQIFIRLASSRENVYRKLSKMRVKPLLKTGITR